MTLPRQVSLAMAKPVRSRGQGAVLQPIREVVLGDHVSALAWSAAGAAIAATLDGCVQAVSTDEATPPRSLSEHVGGALSVDVTAGGLVATGGQDGSLRVLPLAGGPPVLDEAMGPAGVEHLAWSPDGRTLAAAAGKIVRFWQSRGRSTPLGECSAQPGAVTALWWDESGRTLTTVCRDGLRLLGPRRRRPLAHIPLDQAGAVTSALESPDERYIATVHVGGTLSVLQLRSSHSIQYGGLPGKARCLSWSPDSRHLAVAAGDRIAVFGFTARGPDVKRARVLRGHDDRVTALAFLSSSRGPLLASGCESGRLLLWNQGRDFRRSLTLELPAPVENLFADTFANGKPGDARARLAAATRGGRLTIYALTRSEGPR